jgi:hypothetical protein
MRRLTVLSWKAYCRSRGITPAQVSQAFWRKSTFSSMNGNCVEISRLQSGSIGVRDAKDSGSGPILIFTDSEWNAFLAGAKEGQFDNP